MTLDATTIVNAAAGLNARLGRQIEFILELDRLKTVMRRSRLVDGSRYENTAEHSWHLAMMALLLAEWAGPDGDVIEATKAMLVHDIVEIDAGDTSIYDDAGRDAKVAAEEAAAVSWVDHGIRADQVRTVNGPIADASTVLWDLAQQIIDDAEAAGVLSG